MHLLRAQQFAKFVILSTWHTHKVWSHLSYLLYLLIDWKELLPDKNYEMSGYDWYDWLVVKCSKEPEILDISMVGETWMKRCKKHKSHTWCILFLILAVNLIKENTATNKTIAFCGWKLKRKGEIHSCYTRDEIIHIK